MNLENMSNEVSKSWFVVFNHPEEHGYSGRPEEICEKLRDEWIDGSQTRTGAWIYCISAAGLPHVHMVVEDTKALRFSAVKKSYAAGAHLEPTKGTKSQAEAYITKQPPYDEKGERIICCVRHGEIKGAAGSRSDLDEIEQMLEQGFSAKEILRTRFQFRRYEKMIRAACLDKRFTETPALRDVRVHYLVGPSGSGKSFHFVELCKKHGEDNVYHLSDYMTGGFDRYSGEPFLFLDEFKGEWSFAFLLSVMDKYKTQAHARYANIYMLWSDVYIATVYPPEELYRIMVPLTRRGTDVYEQLRRRITDITYCFRDVDGSHQQYTIPMKRYDSYEDLVARAEESVPLPANCDGTTVKFTELNEVGG